jgi:DNA-binding MarR family transcriptional regulator
MHRDVKQVLADYPRVFMACHARHRRDPRTGDRLSAHQASILDHLDATEPRTVSELAQHLGVTASTMSLTLDRLAAAGYLIRERDPGDQRRAHVRLTKAGIRMKEAQQVLEPERVTKLLDRLTPAERTHALTGLSLLARAADTEIASWTDKPASPDPAAAPVRPTRRNP